MKDKSLVRVVNKLLLLDTAKIKMLGRVPVATDDADLYLAGDLMREALLDQLCDRRRR
jgi:hypothetical protein